MFKKSVLIVFIYITIILPVSALNFVNNNLSSFFKETFVETANATCFMYPKGDFKCACRFSDNSKVWSSREITQITGLSTLSPKYGYIKECENKYPVKSRSK